MWMIVLASSCGLQFKSRLFIFIRPSFIRAAASRKKNDLKALSKVLGNHIKLVEVGGSDPLGYKIYSTIHFFFYWVNKSNLKFSHFALIIIMSVLFSFCEHTDDQREKNSDISKKNKVEIVTIINKNVQQWLIYRHALDITVYEAII